LFGNAVGARVNSPSDQSKLPTVADGSTGWRFNEVDAFARGMEEEWAWFGRSEKRDGKWQFLFRPGSTG
jgi:hypothetical protein